MAREGRRVARTWRRGPRGCVTAPRTRHCHRAARRPRPGPVPRSSVGAPQSLEARAVPDQPPSQVAVDRLAAGIRRRAVSLRRDIRADLDVAALLANVGEDRALGLVLGRMDARVEAFREQASTAVADALVEREAEMVLAGVAPEDHADPGEGTACRDRRPADLLAPLTAAVAALVLAIAIVVVPPTTDDGPESRTAGATSLEALGPEAEAVESVELEIPRVRSALERRSSLLLARDVDARSDPTPVELREMTPAPRSEQILKRVAGRVATVTDAVTDTVSEVGAGVEELVEALPDVDGERIVRSEDDPPPADEHDEPADESADEPDGADGEDAGDDDEGTEDTADGVDGSPGGGDDDRDGDIPSLFGWL